ncbi:MAG: tRNA dihydrouridine synthase DusB [Acidimicrobiales bacterium]
MRIGPLELDVPVVLAPMAGVTNAPFRRLCRAQGAGLYVSEMITARAYVEGNDKTQRLAHFDDDEPMRSIQLYGIDAHHVGEAVRRLVDSDHVDHIDLNFGCPAPKVTRNGGGAALPVRRRLLRDIIAAAVGNAGATPVTAKFRMGTDDDHMTFLDTGRIAADEGCAAIALHARTAEQLYSGEARWAAIGALKAAVTTIPVLGNGDIWEASDATAMMAATGCDGVVVGRGCLGRPWLFRDLVAEFEGRPVPPPPTLGEVSATMLEHLDLLTAWAGDWIGVREFRKHTGWYLKGYPVGSEVRRQLNQLGSRQELADALGALDGSLTMTPEGVRAKRGHQGGPRKVSLPDHWFDDPDSTEALAGAAESTTSGG